MGFFAIVNAYTMRVSLSLAITEMVIPINATEYYDPDACIPEYSNTSNSAIKVRKLKTNLFGKKTIKKIIFKQFILLSVTCLAN